MPECADLRDNLEDVMADVVEMVGEPIRLLAVESS
jgi:hypothetical protein